MPIFSHYGDIPDISARLSIPSLVFAIITPLIVIARLAARQSLAGKVGADDWAILASLVFAETVSVMMIIVCEWGFGKHTKELPPALVGKTLELYFFAQILYKINIGLTKVSILLLYLRVFIRPRFRMICLVILGVVVSFTIGSVFSSIFQCTPVEYAFNKKIPGGGKCINLTAFWFANAAFNILSDVVIIVIPAFVINTLQLPKRSKVALCAVFALGTFVCVTSILRITTLNIATSHKDTMWNSIPSSMWTVIESNLGIICASMPALKRPISVIFPSLFARVKGTVTGGKKSTAIKSTPTTATKSGHSGHGTWKGRDGSGSDDTYDLEDAEGSRESQDRILRSKERQGSGGGYDGITKTVEVRVEYDDSMEPPMSHKPHGGTFFHDDSDNFEKAYPGQAL